MKGVKYMDLKARNKAKKTLGEIGLFLIVLFHVIPIVWLLFLSLKTSNEILTEPLKWPEIFHWENYVNAIKTIPFLRMFKNSGLIVAIAVPSTIILDIFVAFAIGRMKFGGGRLQNRVYKIFVCGVVAPTCILMLPVYLLMVKVGLIDTTAAMILTHIGWSASLNVMIMVSGFKSIPDSLEEAAVIDGCNIWQLLWRILVPIAKPVIATAIILTFLTCWNDFALAKFMLISPENHTISLAASYFKTAYSTDYGLTAAASVILILPQLAVFLLFQRYIINGVTAGAVKG